MGTLYVHSQTLRAGYPHLVEAKIMPLSTFFSNRRKASCHYPSLKTEDILTPEGNIASRNVNAVSDRKDSAGSSRSVGSISFKPEVTVGRESDPHFETNKLAPAKIRKKKSTKEHVISMNKCSACPNTTFVIDSPTHGCDKRLKKCLRFIEMDVNDKHDLDNKIVNGPRYKILQESRKVIEEGHRLLSWYKDRKEAGDFVFEIRIAEVENNNLRKKWSTELWVPKWWDPTQDGANYGRYKTLGWKISKPFRKQAVHVLCPLKGYQHCSPECLKPEKMGFLKNFRPAKNVEKMVISMECECESAFPGKAGKTTLPFQKWEVRLYERKRPSTRNDAEEDYLEQIIGGIGRKPSLMGENVPESTAEETKPEIPTDAVESDSNKARPLEDEDVSGMDEEEMPEAQDLQEAMQQLQIQLDRRESQSPTDGNIPAANREEADAAIEKTRAAIQRLRSKLEETDAETLEDENISVTVPQRSQDSDSEA
ncbi:hypothetical protein DSL72_002360 [Monilinia vaccinii-corymbosi]|uniref:Uncharacterized protein n=1 Tax=Monilinia vaccinii-corymbosi TaxID=61207 RepID=A0A8A3PCH0_9HELO|nr:hypothetical protein DSL72_002360 [Monilinia vaccinii-corymbosi]